MAVRLGKFNVDKMLRKLTAKQFMEWEIYAELEPFDETRADYRTAHIVQMLYNINRGRNDKAATIDECLLRFELPERPPAKQTRADQIAIIKAIVAANNAAYGQPLEGYGQIA